jgi:hypothetical protein
MQIRRILISSHQQSPVRRTRSRYPKIQAAIDDQFKRYRRSYSADVKSTSKDDQTTTTTDEGYRSSSSAAKKRNRYAQHRSASVVRISIKIDKMVYSSFIFLGCWRSFQIYSL